RHRRGLAHGDAAAVVRARGVRDRAVHRVPPPLRPDRGRGAPARPRPRPGGPQQARPRANRARVPAPARHARAHPGRAGPRPRLRGVHDEAAVVGDVPGPLGGLRRDPRRGRHPRLDRRAGPAAAARPGDVVPFGHHLGRLVPGAAQRHRRARARPAAVGGVVYFALTEDQREFDAAVRGYLAERFDLAAVRAVFEDTAGDGHPAALWKAAGEQGWLAVMIPEEHDGLGLGLVEAQVIARALGAGVVPGPWRGTVLAAEAVRLAGSDEQKAAWLPRFATGGAVGAFTLRGGVPGGLPAVEYGAVADAVVARSDGGGLALVTGATATPRGSYDGTTRLADLEAGAGEALPGATAEVVDELAARATVLVAADLVGVAREALTRTVAYDTEREQFGVPVGSFQAIKHALADLHVGVT